MRRAESDDTQRGIDRLELRKETTVQARSLFADQVALIDEHDVDMTKHARELRDRLDSAERDFAAEVAAIQSGGIDTRRRRRPATQKLPKVLVDELFDVRER